MDLNTLFGIHWKNNYANLVGSNTTLLLAASGGLDSTVLAHLFKRNSIPFVLAHVNFQLRANESNRDELFVQTLGEQLVTKVLIKRFDTNHYANENKLSIQEAARNLRYEWFQFLLDQDSSSTSIKPFRFIVTAHHANDSIETLLMQFFRGTGIEGLRGIPTIHDEKKIVRPLLSFTRQQLEEYALGHQINYVTDSSNLTTDYTRNFFRNTLIPQLQQVFPQVQENLLHNTKRFAEATQLYLEAIQARKKNLLEYKGKEIHIPILKWKQQVPLVTISWEIIRPFGFTASQTEEAIKLLDGENGAVLNSPTHRLIRNRNWMIIVPQLNKEASNILIETQGITEFEGGILKIDTIQTLPSLTKKEANTEYLDASLIQFPLLLRKWKLGDYFYPLGMTKKKKLSRFFIDLKLSKTEKENCWVIEMDKKIIYVLGHRIDNRLKCTDKTKQFIQLNYVK
jgi:tRNA(Ile)-lysidine synthase